VDGETLPTQVSEEPLKRHLWSLLSALVGRIAPYHPVAKAGDRSSRYGSLRPSVLYLDLALARLSTQLLQAIGVHPAAGATVTAVTTARAEGMWSLDSDIAGVKVVRLSPLNAMPAQGL
jgi:hypothetical protein